MALHSESKNYAIDIIGNNIPAKFKINGLR